MALAEMLMENARLQAELEEAKHTGEELAGLKYKGHVYYKSDGDGPFCAVCVDKDRKLIRVRPHNNFYSDSNEQDGWSCAVCKNTVYFNQR